MDQQSREHNNIPLSDVLSALAIQNKNFEGFEEGEDLRDQSKGRREQPADSLDSQACSHSEHQRSKSICFDFTKGLCLRGDKCKFSHDIATIVQFNSKEKGDLAWPGYTG